MRLVPGVAFSPSLVVWHQQFEMSGAERLREFEHRHNRRIAAPPFQATDVLLGEAGALGELLLRQAILQPDSLDVPPDQPPHIHRGKLAGYILFGLSPIVCKHGFHLLRATMMSRNVIAICRNSREQLQESHLWLQNHRPRPLTLRRLTHN